METILAKQALFTVHLPIFVPSQFYQKNDFEN